MVSATRIRGPFLGPSGYDHHVREFARAISARGIGVELEHLDAWSPVQLPYELRDPWFESLGVQPDARTVVHFSFPTQVTPAERLANINFTMFEASPIPPAWTVAHELVDLVVLPTEHCRRAWIESGVPESKLRLCPLGVRADRFRPGVPPLEVRDVAGQPLTAYRTRFLNVSEIGARKNLAGLMTAWLLATAPADDAVLIIKAGSYSPGSMGLLQADVEVAQHRAGKSLREAAPVHFMHDLLADADMPRLLALGTHYISLSFGEGWDLAMMQAGAAGLRLIAPRHSAYLAYLDEDIASLISARPVPARPGYDAWIGDLFSGASWWVPDQDEAVACIRAAIEGRDEPKASARERLAAEFSWEAAAERLLTILEEAEAMPIRRPAD